MGDLAQATALQGDDGHYTAQLSREWEVWGPNGGYLATIALRAAGRVATIGRPASMHVHYLRVARFEEVSVEAKPVYVGRQTESIAVTMAQQGKSILTALVRTAAENPGLVHDASTPPVVAEPETLPTFEQVYRGERGRFPFWQNYERRVLHPESWQGPPRTQPPHWLEWFRHLTPVDRADPFLDAGRAVVLVDTLCWPAAWRHHQPENMIAPSLDLTVWFHRPAESEWLLGDARSTLAHGGLIAGTCQIWNRERQLVASGGGQMLCTPTR